MKLACTSAAFDRALVRGDLTQLELIDRAARELTCDGVILDERHFPRRDDDYLAQIKKMTTDLGTCVAALSSDAFFCADATEMERMLTIALHIGAPLLCGRLPDETARSWSDTMATLSTATSLAKQHNVTLAIRNAPGTFAGTVPECKRVAKEADSAWLRFAFDDAAFGDDPDLGVVASKRVLTWCQATTPPSAALCALLPFVAVDRADGEATFETMKAAMHRWRRAASETELNRT